MHLRLKLVALVCLFSAPHALAVTYGQAQSLARSLPEGSYSDSDHGKLCEVIGVAKMQELYPTAKVYNGVEYRDGQRVIGELDLVVEEDGVVTHVIEVKCMKNYGSAANKANEQLDRFSRYAGRCDIDFSLEGRPFPCEIFGTADIHYGKMSYEDATYAGFDFDFDLTRKQVLTLIDSIKL
jgi:hypothetical protein